MDASTFLTFLECQCEYSYARKSNKKIKNLGCHFSFQISIFSFGFVLLTIFILPQCEKIQTYLRNFVMKIIIKKYVCSEAKMRGFDRSLLRSTQEKTNLILCPFLVHVLVSSVIRTAGII